MYIMDSDMYDKEPTWELPCSAIDRTAALLMQQQHIPMHFARMLALRGIATEAEAERFVNPSLTISAIRS
jgi:hypothetical protein